MQKDKESLSVLSEIYSYKSAENDVRHFMKDYLLSLIRKSGGVFQIGFYYLFPCKRLMGISFEEDKTSINFFITTDDGHGVVYGFDELLTSDLISLVEYLTDK